jgi:hypothetical protein
VFEPGDKRRKMFFQKTGDARFAMAIKEVPANDGETGRCNSPLNSIE